MTISAFPRWCDDSLTLDGAKLITRGVMYIGGGYYIID